MWRSRHGSGSAAAFAIYALLVSEVGAGRALVITYVAPVVAVALGMAVLDERLGAGTMVGLLLILAGSWLATGGRPPRRTRDRSSGAEAAEAHPP